MFKSNGLIRRLALVGAQPRVAELTREIDERVAERAAIVETFPELAMFPKPERKIRKVRKDRVKRRTMTPEQRAAVSKRMKAHWNRKRREANL
jgi:hypothetical protein